MQQRLFEIVWHLTRTGGATAGQLASRFGVSRRTIYRDIDALSGAGIPVYAEKGKGGGIRLLPEFVLDKAVFSKEEQAQLTAHLQSLDVLGAPDAAAALDKLGALFGQGHDWLKVDFAPWAGGDEMRALFRLLRGAIIGRQRLSFNYTSAHSTHPRLVEPYQVVFRGQGWYLYAYCLKRQAYRYFKLNRMEQAQPAGGTFAQHRPPPVGDTPVQAALMEVVLRFTEGTRFRIMDEFLPQQVAPLPGGGYRVRARFPDDGSWLLGYLLSFGPDLTVEAPAELREQLLAATERMAAAYRGAVPATQEAP